MHRRLIVVTLTAVVALTLTACLPTNSETETSTGQSASPDTPPNSDAAETANLLESAAGGLVLSGEVGARARSASDVVVPYLDEFAEESGTLAGDTFWIRAIAYADPTCTFSSPGCSETIADFLFGFDAITGELVHEVKLGDFTTVQHPSLTPLRLDGDRLWGVTLQRLSDSQFVPQVFAVDIASGNPVVQPTALIPPAGEPEFGTTISIELESFVVSAGELIVSRNFALGDSFVNHAYKLDPTSGQLGPAATLSSSTVRQTAGSLQTLIARDGEVDYFGSGDFDPVRLIVPSMTVTPITEPEIPALAAYADGSLALDGANLVVFDGDYEMKSTVPLGMPALSDGPFWVSVKGDVVAATNNRSGFALVDLASGEVVTFTTDAGDVNISESEAVGYLTDTGVWLATEERLHIVQTPDAAPTVLGEVPVWVSR